MNWKSQDLIDKKAEVRECFTPESNDVCDTDCADQASGIMGADGIGLCNGSNKPAIAIDKGGVAELADGSLKHPIKLTEIQKSIGLPFKTLMGVKSDGSLVKIIPPDHTDCSYKLVADKEGFRFEKDLTENAFDPKFVSSGDPSDFVLGGRITKNKCGEDVLRLVLYDATALMNAQVTIP